jgi:TonB family protein
MHARLFSVFILVATLQGFSQTAATTEPALPQEPRAIFAAAAPFYDFTDAALKPWHLKATYQLYDDNDKPTEQGTYEYWWVSPKVYRSTWTRPGATHTDWHTADGKHAYLTTGEPLRYFEYKLQESLLSPLPDPKELDPAKVRFDRQILKLGSAKLPCVMAILLMPQRGRLQEVPLGLFPTYCFDPNLPALRIHYSWGASVEEFNQIVKVQGKYLAREILLFEGKHRGLTATVDTIEGLKPSDAALTPSPAALVPEVDKVNISAAVAVGSLIKKQQPVYPQDAKDARASGTVVLQATIGREGAIHNLHVISAPWPSLAAASLWAVSQWQYKPYMLNGEPVEVETTVNVIFSLGG